MGDEEPNGPMTVDGGGKTDGPVLAFLHVLADAPGADSVGTALARGLLGAWSPDQVAAYLIDPTGSALIAAVHFGVDPDQLADYSRIPLDLAVPVTEVFRTGEDGSWLLAEAPKNYPSVAGWVGGHPAAETGEVLGLPIRSGGRIVGVLVVSFPQPVERSWRLRVLLDAGATALGVWAAGVLAQGLPSSKPLATRRGVQLTARQRQVLDGVRAGRTNPQIATELTVSVGTVKADLAHLFRIFGVSQRHELVEVTARAGF